MTLIYEAYYDNPPTVSRYPDDTQAAAYWQERIAWLKRIDATWSETADTYESRRRRLWKVHVEAGDSRSRRA